MKRYALRRESDGLLIAPAIMAEPDAAWKTIRQNKAASDFGGTWQLIELSVDVYQQARNKVKAGKAIYLVAGEIVSQDAPAITSDKTSIAADDSDSAVITVNVGNSAYAGTGRYTILPPEGQEIRGMLPFIAGTAALTLTTEQPGLHQVRVDVLEYGVALLEIEGVE